MQTSVSGRGYGYGDGYGFGDGDGSGRGYGYDFDGLRKKHKKVLAGNSKALFKEAVKLDQKLKELNDEE